MWKGKFNAQNPSVVKFLKRVAWKKKDKNITTMDSQLVKGSIIWFN